MIYKTYLSDTTKLLTLPETGMGYQLIEGKLMSEQTTRKYIVYNCELVVDLDEQFQANRRQIIDRGFSNILNEAKSFLIKTDSIRLVSQNILIESRALSSYKQTKNKRHSGGKGAKDNSKEYTKGDETFVRISAYENDKRIDFNRKRLIEGSYATTLVDYYACITTDDDPLDRYSLPNDERIKWAFYIKPTSIDGLQRGIVQPAFGHEGGGEEVYFENGTSDNTYYLKKSYGVI
jgi:hypothetical protein